MENWNLYVITGTELSCGRHTSEVVEQALAGGAEVIQMREKGLTTKELVDLGKQLRELTRSRGATLIVNDRVDIARAIDADGVHVGQDDFPACEARKIIGNDKILGVSTHSLEEALRAEKEGADYIGLGPVFYTDSKQDLSPVLGLEGLATICSQVKIPVVAIGGLHKENAREVIKSGAHCLAVISAVVGAEDICRAAADLRQEIRFAKEGM